jgi:hypothetical protein
MSSSSYLPVDTSINYVSNLHPLDSSSKQSSNYHYNENNFSQSNNFIESISKGDLVNPMTNYQNNYSYNQMPFYPNNSYNMYSSCGSYQPNIYQSQLLVQNLAGNNKYDIN